MPLKPSSPFVKTYWRLYEEATSLSVLLRLDQAHHRHGGLHWNRI